MKIIELSLILSIGVLTSVGLLFLSKKKIKICFLCMLISMLCAGSIFFFCQKKCPTCSQVLKFNVFEDYCPECRYSFEKIYRCTKCQKRVPKDKFCNKCGVDAVGNYERKVK